MNSLVQGEVDWENMVEIALEHRVMPLLYRNLKKFCPQAVPPGILEKLRTYFLINTGRNLALTTKLLELIQLFKGNGITAIPFKGPVLAESIYGDPALRQFDDLDVLIHRNDAIKAFQLLVSYGYRPEVSIDAEQFKAYLKTENSLALYTKDSEMLVELHWELTGRYTGYSFDLAHIENRLETGTISGREIRQLSPEDLLVYLCIHGSKDRWNHLDSICCVAELVRSHPDMKWVRVEHLAGEIHCRRMLDLGLFLANHLLDAELPIHILERINIDPELKIITLKIGKTLFPQFHRSSASRVNSDFSIFHMTLKDRIIDKLRHVFYLLFLPSRQDWRYFSLPVNLSFLYYPLRPARLAWESGSTLVLWFVNTVTVKNLTAEHAESAQK
jgi:hypothetical protein